MRKQGALACFFACLWLEALAFSNSHTAFVARTSSTVTQPPRTIQHLAISDRDPSEAGSLEELKQLESELEQMLSTVRTKKLKAIRAKPLTIGVVGFGRFGRFIARTFSKYGRVVVTSRSDYSDIAKGMGVAYVPLHDPAAFLEEEPDVILFSVSILSFERTIKSFSKHLQNFLDKRAPGARGPLIVDVCSVKEHARNIMLDLLPKECDILCTHPMFGPDSGKDGWDGLNFVYEKTRIDGVVLDQSKQDNSENFVDENGKIHSVHEDSESHVEGVDRMERFLSIWEEEGCRMVPMSCLDHDAYAANSQFITHLVGRVLGNQGLSQTPIDTSGFQSVLSLVGSTTADSFDLFYGLYKFNQNSAETIRNLQSAMDEVITNLKLKEQEEKNYSQASSLSAALLKQDSAAISAAARLDSSTAPDDEKAPNASAPALAARP